jgi:hypothetical protein
MTDGSKGTLLCFKCRGRNKLVDHKTNHIKSAHASMKIPHEGTYGLLKTTKQITTTQEHDDSRYQEQI